MEDKDLVRPVAYVPLETELNDKSLGEFNRSKASSLASLKKMIPTNFSPRKFSPRKTKAFSPRRIDKSGEHNKEDDVPVISFLERKPSGSGRPPLNNNNIIKKSIMETPKKTIEEIDNIISSQSKETLASASKNETISKGI